MWYNTNVPPLIGDLLCLDSPDLTKNELPSPQQLRRKILVKAKRQMTSEDAAMASEPQLQPRINEASTPLLLEKTTTTTIRQQVECPYSLFARNKAENVILI